MEILFPTCRVLTINVFFLNLCIVLKILCNINKTDLTGLGSLSCWREVCTVMVWKRVSVVMRAGRLVKSCPKAEQKDILITDCTQENTFTTPFSFFHVSQKQTTTVDKTLNNQQPLLSGRGSFALINSSLLSNWSEPMKQNWKECNYNGTKNYFQNTP